MISGIEKIETFFGKNFEILASSLSETRELICFDGYAHWRIWVDEEKQWIHLTADKQPFFLNPFPLLEVAMFCSSVRIEPLSPIGSVIYFFPKGFPQKHNLVAITKTREGRLSFCTTTGETSDSDPEGDWQNLSAKEEQ